MAASHWWAEETAAFMHAAMIAYGKIEVAIKLRRAELYSGSDPGPIPDVLTITEVSTGKVHRYGPLPKRRFRGRRK